MSRMTPEQATRLLLAQSEQISGQARIIAASSRRVASLEAQVNEIARLAGIPRSHLASLRVQADENNPAQPVPQPAAEAPEATSEEALGTGAHPVSNDQPAGGNSEGTTDLTTPGATPVTNVAPAATTTVDSQGADIQTPAYAEDQNVTAPVAGTEGPLPIADVKTETDVRVGQGDNSSAFPIEPDGGFAQQVSTTTMASVQNRIMASIRLANLRVKAGISNEDAMELGDKIASSDLSTEVIEHEIRTLEATSRVATRQERPRHLVPRVAGPVEAESVAIPQMSVVASVSSDEFLWD